MLKKIRIPHIDWLPLIIIAFIFFKIINNIDTVTDGLNVIMSSISAIIWGFAIAYLLNPLMNLIEKKFKTKRSISILIVYIIVTGAIILLITIISPRIVQSAKDLYDSRLTYTKQVEEWFNNSLLKLKEYDSFGLTDKASETFDSFIDSMKNLLEMENLKAGLTTAFSKAIDVTSSVVKVIFGFIIAIYVLKDKENFIKNLKKFIYALFKKDTAENLVYFGKEVNIIFSKYIIGKFIDSLIISLICLVILSIFRIPFASLISLIVGVTNMIPYFGPIIGMVPAVIITLLASPFKALLVLIILIILQQFDGWFLGPKILGSQVGLSPFLIILAILIGGGMFGVPGMFLGAPVMAVLKMLLERFVNKRMSDKNIKL